MPLPDIFSRDGRDRRRQEKLDNERAKLIEDEAHRRKLAENREKIAAYMRQMREKQIAEESEKLKRRQEIARQQALEKEEARKQKDAAYQALLAKEKEQELERIKQKHNEDIRRLERVQSRNDSHAKAQLAEERRRLEQVTEQLRQEREEREDARRNEEARRLKAKRRIEEHQRRIEMQKEEHDEKIRIADAKRKQDHLTHHNTPEALQELRDLIRERYELDMEIWRERTDMSYANRDLVKKRMDKSDEILQKIRSAVENWTPESFPDEDEWEYAQDIQERLLANGKRIWALDPPWTDREVGQKGRNKPPQRGRNKPPPAAPRTP